MKRLFLKSFVFCILSVLLTSCTTVREVPMGDSYSTDFVGKDCAYVTFVCGDPTSEIPDGKGGKVLEYRDVEAFVAKTGTDIVAAKQKAGAYVQFFFDGNGLCYSVRTNHIRHVSELDKTKTWVTVASSIGGAGVLTSVLAFIFSLLR